MSYEYEHFHAQFPNFLCCAASYCNVSHGSHRDDLPLSLYWREELLYNHHAILVSGQMQLMNFIAYR
jgi:hypothetical protein